MIGVVDYGEYIINNVVPHLKQERTKILVSVKKKDIKPTGADLDTTKLIARVEIIPYPAPTLRPWFKYFDFLVHEHYTPVVNKPKFYTVTIDSSEKGDYISKEVREEKVQEVLREIQECLKLVEPWIADERELDMGNAVYITYSAQPPTYYYSVMINKLTTSILF